MDLLNYGTDSDEENRVMDVSDDERPVRGKRKVVEDEENDSSSDDEEDLEPVYYDEPVVPGTFHGSDLEYIAQNYALNTVPEGASEWTETVQQQETNDKEDNVESSDEDDDSESDDAEDLEMVDDENEESSSDEEEDILAMDRLRRKQNGQSSNNEQYLLTEEEAEGGPTGTHAHKTKNEVDEDIPEVPLLQPVLETAQVRDISEQLIYVGDVLYRIDHEQTVVIQASASSSQALGEGSVLCNGEGLIVGVVHEVFGPVTTPFYIVRYRALPSSKSGTKPAVNKDVKQNKTVKGGRRKKGSNKDASNEEVEGEEALTIAEETAEGANPNDGAMDDAIGDEPSPEGEEKVSTEIPSVIQPGVRVFVAPPSSLQGSATFSFLTPQYLQSLRSIKGSDASNVYDEEPSHPDEIEYSDDEAEAAAKKQLKQQRRQQQQSQQPALPSDMIAAMQAAGQQATGAAGPRKVKKLPQNQRAVHNTNVVGGARPLPTTTFPAQQTVPPPQYFNQQQQASYNPQPYAQSYVQPPQYTHYQQPAAPTYVPIEHFLGGGMSSSGPTPPSYAPTPVYDNNKPLHAFLAPTPVSYIHQPPVGYAQQPVYQPPQHSQPPPPPSQPHPSQR